MKVLILANYDVGLYKFRKELLQRLLDDKHEVFISLPYGKLVNKMIEMGCVFFETPIERRGTNPIKDLKLLTEYDRIIRKIRPDMVFTYTIKPNVYGGIACQKNKVRYVANVTGLGSAVENGGLMQKITSFLYKTGLRKAQKVFFQNEANLDFMKSNNILGSNYDLIPGSGVNLEQYRYCSYPDDETVDFVYVGRMMKEKGFGLYIEAAKIIREKYPQSRFHVCGDYEDDYRETVDKLISNNILIYHGLVEDMADIYKSIDCTVHPSYYPEGMSNVLLESLACGRPIITTDRPGCKEIVDDGINGFVVKQKDLNDLVNKIEKFILLDRNSKEKMGQNGRKKVEQHFDRNIVIAKYMKELETIDGKTN